MGDDEKHCEELSADLYDRYRRNIEHEDDLINHRLSWLLIAQSFLFGACVAANQAPLVVRLVAIAICLASYPSLVAAVLSIRQLNQKCNGRIPAEFPNLVGVRPLHMLGLIAPMSVPIIFIIGWLVY